MRTALNAVVSSEFICLPDMSALYPFLDTFLLAFHTLFTLFNMFGFIFRKTRKLHFITMTLTAFSWLVLGYFYGWGYCFLTDWHWHIRDELNNPVPFVSYIQFLVHELTGYAPERQLTDTLTATVAILSYLLSILLLLRDYYRKKKANA